jgi:hypothetical protein
MGDGAVQTSVKNVTCLISLRMKCFLCTYNPFPNHFIIENFCRQAADKMGQCGVTIYIKILSSTL